jgi:V8-like Glu-specific endopeptidase
MQYFLKQMCLIVGIFQGAMVANTALATDMDRQWLAVGRLNVTGGGFCTATLIGEMHVLTAAHCIYDAQSGAPVDADDLEFRAGW